MLAERLAEVERRLTGHADERRAGGRAPAAAGGRRHRRGAAGLPGGRRPRASWTQLWPTCARSHRRQLEAVRAGRRPARGAAAPAAGRRARLAAVRGRLQKIELDLVEATVRRESVIESLRRELGCGPEEAAGAPEPEAPRGPTRPAGRSELEAELAALGPVNPLALEELAEHSGAAPVPRGPGRGRPRAPAGSSTRSSGPLDDEIMHVFDAAFADVNEHFSTWSTTLFPGGTGRLSLTDPENLLDTGVEVEVRPAGRNVRRLSLLSGGERSLVALAFLFAVFRSRPSPFYLMDEVEAALDDVNLQRFLGLVHEFRDEAQLIIVSHQKRTMEAADALYGVTMAPGGSSQVVSQKVPADRRERPARPVSPDGDLTAQPGPVRLRHAERLPAVQPASPGRCRACQAIDEPAGGVPEAVDDVGPGTEPGGC